MDYHSFYRGAISKFFFNGPNVFSTLRDLLYVYADVCNSRTLFVVRDTWNYFRTLVSW